MNKTFQDHVTSVAFFLSMSKQQIQALFCVEDEGHNSQWLVEYNRTVPTLQRLHSKGLIVYGDGILQMTEAGRITCKLLREAGFKYHKRILQAVA